MQWFQSVVLGGVLFLTFIYIVLLLAYYSRYNGKPTIDPAWESVPPSEREQLSCDEKACRVRKVIFRNTTYEYRWCECCKRVHNHTNI